MIRYLLTAAPVALIATMPMPPRPRPSLAIRFRLPKA
jgi:hypothetical protein